MAFSLFLIPFHGIQARHHVLDGGHLRAPLEDMGHQHSNTCNVSSCRMNLLREAGHVVTVDPDLGDLQR